MRNRPNPIEKREETTIQLINKEIHLKVFNFDST